MTQARKLILSIPLTLMMVLSACSLLQPAPVAPSPTIVSTTQVPTVAATATEMPTIVPPTSTPLPTQTETPTSTVALPIATIAPPTATIVPPVPPIINDYNTTQSSYSCDVISQKPADDTIYGSGTDFDVKWTIKNSGTQRWKEATILKYQSGPKLTDVSKITLPRLKPGEDTVVILDATAIGKSGTRQVMVWAVIGPDSDGAAKYWMCYPYVRIMIK